MNSLKMTTEAKESKVGGIDVNLPLTAILAASELDQFSKGRPSPMVHLRNLSGYLKNSFQAASSHESFVSSSSVAVVWEALSVLPSQPNITTTTDLVRRALDLAGQLDPAELKDDQQSLESLKRFCIALSSSAAAFRNSTFDVQESYPLEV